MKNLTFLSRSIYEVIFLRLKFNKKSRVYVADGLNFNWGIIWNILNPLIIVAGWSLLFELGIRGQRHSLEYFAPILTLWLSFSNSVQTNLNAPYPEIFKSQKGINLFNVMLSDCLYASFSTLIRILVVSLILNIFLYELSYFRLTVGYFCICFLVFSYLSFTKIIFYEKPFLVEAHGYFFQALFLFSSIIIPVTILPESIRDIILYNPLVHLFEWIKFATTGIYYDYIDIGYFLKFLASLLLLSPIFLYELNKKYN